MSMDEAIQAFRAAYTKTMQRFNMTEWHGVEAGIRAALPHLQPDCKVPPQNVQSPPETATDVAIDDAEVERVARAMWACAERWDTWETMYEDARDGYLAEARAAIRAIREGQRWGVFQISAGSFIGNSPTSGDDFTTTDRNAAVVVCDLMNRMWPQHKYEVRPYTPARAKTPEDIGRRIASRVASAVSAQAVTDLADEINAAIRDASKEKTNGK